VAAPGLGRSAGRFPDGADTDSNCTDFLTQAATTLPAGSVAGATNIKVASVDGFEAGQTVTIDGPEHPETAVIAAVGTAGAAGTGITLTAPLAQAHGYGAQIADSVPTPGAANRYYRKRP
jgi:hypothetical protein